MRRTHFSIGRIPAVLYGPPADRVYLFLHGQQGNKEEAEAFAQEVCSSGIQVLAVDLPGHGARQERGETLLPWAAVPELEETADYLRGRWGSYALRANSIGAWLAMLALEAPDRALLVSPILDMERLILEMMGWAGVTEERLRAEGEIPTSFGQILSWKYLCWAREHRPHDWTCPIHILYGSGDNMTARETVEEFARRRSAHLTVLEGGEHWLHTPAQLAALRRWERESA